MSNSSFTRRQFLATASAGTLAAVAARSVPAYANAGKKAGKCAILGGQPIRTKPFPSWPVWDKSAEESVLGVLLSVIILVLHRNIRAADARQNSQEVKA